MFGLYYTKPIFSAILKKGNFSLGLSISNIGPKITYNSASDLDYIP